MCLACVRVPESHLELELGLGLLGAELDLPPQLLQRHVGLLEVHPVALPASVQLALRVSVNKRQTKGMKLSKFCKKFLY